MYLIKKITGDNIMAQQDREIFFENAANHSIAKITLLKEYLTIWIRKITYGLKSKCLICDTFAGEGIYSDGTKGSPFVILDVVQDYLNQMLCNLQLIRWMII